MVLQIIRKNVGWGYTSILTLERAVVPQQSDSPCLHLAKLERYLGIVRGLKYNTGMEGIMIAEESLDTILATQGILSCFLDLCPE